MMNILLVCGGRDATAYEPVAAELNLALQQLTQQGICIEAVLTGGAKGVDYLAAKWAMNRGLASLVCPANWAYHGRSAGPIRNRIMARLNPVACVAFPGGAGTQGMISLCKEFGIRIKEIHDG